MNSKDRVSVSKQLFDLSTVHLFSWSLKRAKIDAWMMQINNKMCSSWTTLLAFKIVEKQYGSIILMLVICSHLSLKSLCACASPCYEVKKCFSLTADIRSSIISFLIHSWRPLSHFLQWNCCTAEVQGLAQGHTVRQGESRASICHVCPLSDWFTCSLCLHLWQPTETKSMKYDARQ